MNAQNQQVVNSTASLIVTQVLAGDYVSPAWYDMILSLRDDEPMSNPGHAAGHALATEIFRIQKEEPETVQLIENEIADNFFIVTGINLSTFTEIKEQKEETMERVEPLHNEAVTDQPTDAKATVKDSETKEIKVKNRPGILLMTGVSVLTSVVASIVSGKLAGASKTSELVDGVAVSAVVSGAIASSADILLRNKSTVARVTTAVGIGLGAGVFGGRAVISKEELEQMVESISPEA